MTERWRAKAEPTESEWQAITDAYPRWEDVDKAVIAYGSRVAAEVEAQTREEMRWQPIATAPKDGRKLRLRRVYERRVITDGVGFFGDVTIGYGEDDGGPQTLRAKWVADDGVHLFPEPTHWMPLPAPPAAPDIPAASSIEITACGLTRIQLHDAVAALDDEQAREVQADCPHLRIGANPQGVLCRDCRKQWTGEKAEAIWRQLQAPDIPAAPPATPELDYERVARLQAGEAMFALVALLKSLGHPFDSWPDDVKDKFAEAIIDRRPLTEADIERTKQLFPEYFDGEAAAPPAGAEPAVKPNPAPTRLEKLYETPEFRRAWRKSQKAAAPPATPSAEKDHGLLGNTAGADSQEPAPRREDRALIAKLLDDLEESDDRTQTVIDFVATLRRESAFR